MLTLLDAVTQQLKAQGSTKETVILWQRVYESFQSGDVEGVEGLLQELLESPEED